MVSKISKLRSVLAEKGLSAYLVPKNDEYMSTTLPSSRDRLKHLTGFSGSNGYTVVFADQDRKPSFVTDSRYDIQAFKEIDDEVFDISTKSTPLSQVIKNNQQEDHKFVLGLDANLFPKSQVDALKAISDVEVKVNLDSSPLIDQALQLDLNQDATSSADYFIHDHTFCGVDAASKIQKVAEKLNKDHKAQSLYVNMLEEISWLLNVKATGIHEFDPIFNASLLLRTSEATIQVDLFVEDSHVSNDIFNSIRGQLEHANIKFEVHKQTDFTTTVERAKDSLGKVALDSMSSTQLAFEVFNKFSGEQVVLFEGISPVSQFKIIKNETELEGLSEALIIESAALVSFYAQIKRMVEEGTGFYEH